MRSVDLKNKDKVFFKLLSVKFQTSIVTLLLTFPSPPKKKMDYFFNLFNLSP